MFDFGFWVWIGDRVAFLMTLRDLLRTWEAACVGLLRYGDLGW